VGEGLPGVDGVKEWTIPASAILCATVELLQAGYELGMLALEHLDVTAIFELAKEAIHEQGTQLTPCER